MNIWEAVIIAVSSALLGVMLTVGINWRPKPKNDPEPTDEVRHETAHEYVFREMTRLRAERKLFVVKAVERSYEANR